MEGSYAHHYTTNAHLNTHSGNMEENTLENLSYLIPGDWDPCLSGEEKGKTLINRESVTFIGGLGNEVEDLNEDLINGCKDE